MPRAFTVSDLESDVGRVVASAEENGSAAVVDDDGHRQFVINIPQEDLPPFNDNDE